jgi:hypothetical protein
MVGEPFSGLDRFLYFGPRVVARSNPGLQLANAFGVNRRLQNTSSFGLSRDLIKFIKEYRRVNPGISFAEAKSDYTRFRSILEG